MWGRNPKKEEAKRERNKQIVKDVLSGLRVECSHTNPTNPINQPEKMVRTNDKNDQSTVSAVSEEDDGLCGYCNMTVVENGIQCDQCGRWNHYDLVCSGIDDVNGVGEKILESDFISYTCQRCYGASASASAGSERKLVNKDQNKIADLEATVKELKNEIETLTFIMKEGFNRLQQDISEMKAKTKLDEGVVENDALYSSKLKKNTLVIKSTVNTNKASDSKKSIMENISTNVEQVKTSKQGHLLIKFADENKMEEAKNDLERMKDDINVTVDKKDMLDPKIQVCDVDVVEENIIENIKEKNQWINDLVNNDADFKLIKTKESMQENRMHVIIKCSPLIRGAIRQRYDKLYTTYGRCRVHDSYMPYQCYKCQEFGHSADKCNKELVCAKCSLKHKTGECHGGTLKCNNCARKGHADTNHRAFDRKCPIYTEEVTRIKNKTDHGF